MEKFRSLNLFVVLWIALLGTMELVCGLQLCHGDAKSEVQSHSSEGDHDHCCTSVAELSYLEDDFLPQLSLEKSLDFALPTPFEPVGVGIFTESFADYYFHPNLSIRDLHLLHQVFII